MSDEASDRERAFARRLMEWYARHGRSFSWREEPTPYRVAVAEILLQKTAVAPVVPIFQQLVERYPDFGSLSEATADSILRVIQPLGLPRRAELLHQLAKEVVKRGGKLPESEEELAKLPGLGPYAAAAIASLAFGRRAAMVDINAMRVLGRVFSEEYSARAGPPRAIRERALRLMPHGREAEMNLALVDFGALVCRARLPLHEGCPVQEICDFRQGTGRWQEERVEEPGVSVRTECEGESG